DGPGKVDGEDGRGGADIGAVGRDVDKRGGAEGVAGRVGEDRPSGGNGGGQQPGGQPQDRPPEPLLSSHGIRPRVCCRRGASARAQTRGGGEDATPGPAPKCPENAGKTPHTPRRGVAIR